MKLKIRGDEIKKKSSPLKLLSQFQPNFAEMIKIGKSSKFIKNPVIHVKKFIIMLIQFKFWHFLA
jgi:hypothetical protein